MNIHLALPTGPLMMGVDLAGVGAHCTQDAWPMRLLLLASQLAARSPDGATNSAPKQTCEQVAGPR